MVMYNSTIFQQKQLSLLEQLNSHKVFIPVTLPLFPKSSVVSPLSAFTETCHEPDKHTSFIFRTKLSQQLQCSYTIRV